MAGSQKKKENENGNEFNVVGRVFFITIVVLLPG